MLASFTEQRTMYPTQTKMTATSIHQTQPCNSVYEAVNPMVPSVHSTPETHTLAGNGSPANIRAQRSTRGNSTPCGAKQPIRSGIRPDETVHLQMRLERIRCRQCGVVYRNRRLKHFQRTVH